MDLRCCNVDAVIGYRATNTERFRHKHTKHISTDYRLSLHLSTDAGVEHVTRSKTIIGSHAITATCNSIRLVAKMWLSYSGVSEVKLLIQHVVRGDSRGPVNGNRPW